MAKKSALTPTGPPARPDNLRRGHGHGGLAEPARAGHPALACQGGEESRSPGTGYQQPVEPSGSHDDNQRGAPVATVSVGEAATDHGLPSWASLNHHREQHLYEKPRYLAKWSEFIGKQKPTYQDL